MGPVAREKKILLFVNNKGADQPSYPRILVNAFVICLSESIKLSTLNMKYSVVEQAGLGLI